ncbi:hypothetical protein SDC9_05161 [bioreactor metagenome]|uniref:Uncharacterized protein n=1 Tax=bioreactor metagenome TaxID=1076179 RepID=A0A644SZB0_9ZZZZ
MEIRTYFSPDGVGGGSPGEVADTVPSDPIPGQAENTPAPAGQVEQGTFLDLDDEKGVRKSYRTKDEFLKDWKNMGMMRSDYTRKTAEIAKLREEHERARAEWDSKRQEESSKYEKYNQFLRNNPDIYRQLQEAVKSGPSTRGVLDGARQYADEKYAELEKKLSDMEGWKKGREQEEAKRKLYDSFKSRYEDFDETSIEDSLKVLSEGDSEAILDLLYHSIKGRASVSPLEVEKRIVDRIQAKGSARVLPGNGPVPKAPGSYKSMDEAEQAALAGLH